jgi:hypothetical protein
VAGGIGGGVIGLIVGAMWIALAPDNDFADLAAAAVTTVVLIPTGVVLGVVAAVVTRRGSVKASGVAG